MTPKPMSDALPSGVLTLVYRAGRPRTRVLFAALLVTVLSAAIGAAPPPQQQRPPSAPTPHPQPPPVPHPPPVPREPPRQPIAQFSSGVQLVEVYATVVDDKGEVVSGLPRDAFEVYEDGQRQTVQAFAAGDFPLSAAIAIDRSASMAGERLERAKVAARAFLEALRPDDQAAIISISGRVEELVPLSTDRRAQREAIDGLTPWSTTALHDAIVEAIELVQRGTGRRALVLLSDGVDRYSARTLNDALEHARRSDALIYPIALGRATTPLFPRLASLSGGRSFHAANTKGLEAILTGIARELREQYLLGYTPARPSSPEGEPEWHSIEVRVRQPGLRVRARDGYYGR